MPLGGQIRWLMLKATRGTSVPDATQERRKTEESTRIPEVY